MSRSLVTCAQIRAARALLSWSQKDLGDAIKVSDRQIRFWEKRLPTNKRKQQKLVAAFNRAGVILFADPAPGVCFAND